MPYAKTDVGLIREHFAAVPDKHRAAAIALYLELVLTSAELLLDGSLPRRVVEAGAAEIGISRGRYARREIASVATSLVDCGLVEIANDGTWQLIYWADHHASREYVDNRRKQDAERKRGARGQLTINDDRGKSAADVRSQSAADNVRTRARDARTRAASDSKTKDLQAAAASYEDPAPDEANPAAAALLARLDDLGLNGQAQQLALNDPGRARAWIDLAAIEAKTNPAMFVLAGLRSGEWPSARARKPDPAVDGPARRERFTRGDGLLLPADELEFQLGEMGAGEDELVGLLELAADLRSADG